MSRVRAETPSGHHGNTGVSGNIRHARQSPLTAGLLFCHFVSPASSRAGTDPVHQFTVPHPLYEGSKEAFTLRREPPYWKVYDCKRTILA